MGTVAPSAPVVRKRRYLGNLIRFRAVNHSLFFGLLAAFALSWAGGVGVIIGLILGYGLTMYYYLGVQLACRACASRLHAVRSHGEVLRCHKCGQPTDRAVDMGLGV